MIDLSKFNLAELDDEPRVQYTGRMKWVISVSELKLIPPEHKGCPRKWALMRLAKLPKVPNEALIDGTILHKCIYHALTRTQLEWSAEWQRDKLSPTGKSYRWYASLALALLRHLTEAEKRDGVSEPTFFLEIPELDAALYIKPDFLTWKKFRDWKSTAALKKTSPWVLQDPSWWGGAQGVPQNGEFLTITNDIQSRVYAHGLMQLLNWDVIDAEWVYGCKKFGGAQSVKTWTCPARFERDETRAWVERYIHPMIEFVIALKQAYAARDLDSPLLVPHNPKACEHKGRFCDAWTTCRLFKSPIALGSIRLPVLPP